MPPYKNPLYLLLLLLAGIVFVIIASTDRVLDTRDDEIRNRMKCVGLALHNHQSSLGHLPPANHIDPESGQAVHSWRYDLAPLLDSPPFEIIPMSEGRWDDELFAAWRKYPQGGLCEDGTTTHIAAITGEASPLSDAVDVSLEDVDDETILIVYAPKFSAHWMEPKDIEYRSLEQSADQTVEQAFGTPAFGYQANGQVVALDPASKILDHLPRFRHDARPASLRSLPRVEKTGENEGKEE